MTKLEHLQTVGDHWALVELFRHEHGELPKSDDDRRVDVPTAAATMAVAVSKGQVSTHNAAIVIAHLGRQVQLLADVATAARAVGCSCLMRQGHPQATHHSPACQALLDAIAAVEASPWHT